MSFKFIKYASEEITKAIDFSGMAEIQAGETILSVNVGIMKNGTLIQNMLVGSLINGNSVFLRIKDGEYGNYLISVLATTSGGHKRLVKLTMHVI